MLTIKIFEPVGDAAKLKKAKEFNNIQDKQANGSKYSKLNFICSLQLLLFSMGDFAIIR